MANAKISALTSATTPLAGTEVLPIVQSGSTVKVSVANLTVGRAVATAGGSFTDNITQSTAAKGIDFTANTPAAGMTSQLLNWYEEGTWTPTVTASTGTITNVVTNGTYTRIGRQVTIYARIEINNNGTGAGDLRVTGMPYAAADAEMFNCAGREDRTVGFAWAASAVSATEIRMTKYDGTYPGGTLYEFSLICTYFA